MSLINQMLKDLEKRRADSVSDPDSPLSGVSRYNVANRRPPYLVYGLGVLAVILIGLVGFLGWAYYNSLSATAVQASTTTPTLQDNRSPELAEAPAAQAKIPAADPEPSAPRVTGSSVSEPVNSAAAKTTTEATESGKAEQKQPRQQTESPTRSVTSSRPSAGEESVTKRSRPLSHQQQAELAYQKGYRLLAREQTEAGERYLREALESYRHHHRARELLAGVYIKSGRYVEAASLLRDGVALAPEHSLFAKLYARVLFKQGKLQHAIKVLEHQPPLPGVDSEYHALLAAIYQQNGEYLKAAGSYRDVLRVEPNQGRWWIGLAVSLEQLSKFDEARKAYQKARNSPGLAENLKQFVDKRLNSLSDG